MASLCKHGKIKDARDLFDSMEMKGLRPNIVSYLILLNRYATKGCLVDMTDLFNLMLGDSIAPNSHIFSVLIKAYANCGMLDRATIIFNEMREQGVKPNVHDKLYVDIAVEATADLRRRRSCRRRPERDYFDDVDIPTLLAKRICYLYRSLLH
ncbi:protein Rf1, mitochondrial [Sorghum bicolor]|uniref:protein Rf1, mitochondrial n=1 Tax=Sorghum bicolor TaxID=4558 RepID=UPI000B425423|nr:protein Rf1, mitochondrial [Sorghum bicolor]|eukprot:XP_002442513.2 protein Rf1, mitochondrial [Sorghum bicolor]